MPLLSVIIPVYNESQAIGQALDKINSVAIDKEIIIVDDGSSDGTDKVLRGARCSELKVIHHSSKRGRGAAFLTGLASASGEYVIAQNGNLEYEPNDYPKLISAIKENNVDMVLGARFRRGYRGLFTYRLGNRLLTGLLNLLFGCHLHDYATCYKLACRSTFYDLNLQGRGFDIDVEIISKAQKKKKRLLEIPISYYCKAGKKIRWKDGVWTIFYMFKYRFWR